MKSLDPRVNRLPLPALPAKEEKPPFDQFGTFEVFVRPKEGKPFQHEGIVHAPNLEMGFVLAKEAFTRRFLCVSLCIVDTSEVIVSPMTEGDTNAYDQLLAVSAANGNAAQYEIYHLARRGKQHVHAGTVTATGAREAMMTAGHQFAAGKIYHNVWAIRTDAIRFTTADEEDLWMTLPEKKFRDAADYKGGEKLKVFIQTWPHKLGS